MPHPGMILEADRGRPAAPSGGAGGGDRKNGAGTARNGHQRPGGAALDGRAAGNAGSGISGCRHRWGAGTHRRSCSRRTRPAPPVFIGARRRCGRDRPRRGLAGHRDCGRVRSAARLCRGGYRRHPAPADRQCAGSGPNDRAGPQCCPARVDAAATGRRPSRIGMLPISAAMVAIMIGRKRIRQPW